MFLGRHVYSFCQQAGAQPSGEYRGHTFVLQKGVFCELYIRGVEGNVIVDEEFSAVYRKIKEISPRVNNTSENISEGSERASECCD